MCTWIIEKAAMSGSGKGTEGWFTLSQANVYYDHPFHAPLDHALIIDFVQDPERPGHRVAVELTADSARRLVHSILAALDTGIDAHIEGEAQAEGEPAVDAAGPRLAAAR